MSEQPVLTKHGDKWERDLWPFVQVHFPAYEVLWRDLIVPLTNRASDAGTVEPQKWHRVRSDVPTWVERGIVCHYSVFYYAGRAAKLISLKPQCLIEDVIHLLCTSCENFHALYQWFRLRARDSGGANPFSKRQWPRDYPEVMRDIDSYRNVVLHNPVLGRRVKDEIMAVPKVNVLEGCKDSWSTVESLSDADFIAVDDLLRRLSNDLLDELNKQWREFIEVLPVLKRKGLLGTMPESIADLPLAAGPYGGLNACSASGTHVGNIRKM